MPHTPNPPNGKTIADLIDGTLASPTRLLTVIALFSSLAGLAILVMWAVTRLFGVQTKELQLGGAGSHVVFQRTDSSGDTESLVVVNPEGWQKTTLSIMAGDRLTFSANGRVAIDMHEIWNNAELRGQFERMHAAQQGIRANDASETRVPEDFFTPEERQQLILNRPWVDPDGFDLKDFAPEFRSRRSRYLLPNEHAGGLVAAIKGDADGMPGRNDAVFVGKSMDYLAPRDGWLWFTINDVQYADPDHNNPSLFYNDNIGSFWARVVVKRK
jgi:hypothetical protein